MNGVRDTAAPRVVVGVGSVRGDVETLRRAAGLARDRDAVLVVVTAWQPITGLHPAGSSVLELDWFREDLARDVQNDICRLALTADDTLRLEQYLVCDTPTAALLRCLGGPEDVLVVGRGRPGRLRRWFIPTISSQCARRARCEVLVTPPPALERELPPGLYHRLRRSRSLNPEYARLLADAEV